MTEAEWLTCDDPERMLAFALGKASERKLRLFAVARCRRACGVLQSQHFRDALDVSERFADGSASDDKLRKARSQVRQSAGRTFRHVRAFAWSRAIQSQRARWMVVAACSRDMAEVLSATSRVCVAASSTADYEAKCELERRHQAALLREVVRYPFGPVTLSSAWLTSTVVSLAEGIYGENAFDRMPILADALQDAGCDNPDLLDHCRGPGPHVRGCWVVDLVLGKE